MTIMSAAEFEARSAARSGTGAPVKYSKLAVIRALGSAWPEYRARLEDAGLLDAFFAAEYLASDDPDFAAFLATVPEELRARLEDCVWNEA